MANQDAAATAASSPSDESAPADVTPAGNAVTRNTTPAEILLLYGLTLMVCGALAFRESGYKPKAVSSLYLGNGSAVVCFLMAAGCRKIDVKKGEPGYKSMMISIHLALLFPLLLTGVVSWRLALAWNDPQKSYIIPYFAAFILSSLLSFGVLYSFKPAKKSADKHHLSQDQQAKMLLNNADDTTSSIVTDYVEMDNMANGMTDSALRQSESVVPRTSIVPSLAHPSLLLFF